MIGGAWITWLVYRNSEERVFISDDKLIKKQFWRRESLALDAIRAIGYRYYRESNSGFIAAWEFNDAEQKPMVVESNAKGLDSVFAQLQQQLPQFSLDQFEQQLQHGKTQQGRVEIWRRDVSLSQQKAPPT